MIIFAVEFWVGCSSLITQGDHVNMCMKQKAFLEDVFIFPLVGVGGGAEWFLIYAAKGFNILYSINIHFFKNNLILRVIL